MNVTLVFFKPTGEQKTIRIDKETTLIGRGQDCDLRVPIEMCSRQHCQFEVRQGGVVLRDLGSANGTFVNNERVNEVTLSPGDKITIGPVTFTLQVDGQPADIAPPKTPPAAAPATSSEANVDGSAISSDDTQEADSGEIGLAAIEDDDDDDPLAALEGLASEEEDGNENPLG
ncbi:MAG: FHA domain-containing protein [Planctomycetes bacterium]|jgi:predicted component of type VI protein secretion system|nr:FHA domain-containing protein [Planctomycetota bacterium]